MRRMPAYGSSVFVMGLLNLLVARIASSVVVFCLFCSVYVEGLVRFLVNELQLVSLQFTRYVALGVLCACAVLCFLILSVMCDNVNATPLLHSISGVFLVANYSVVIIWGFVYQVLFFWFLHSFHEATLVITGLGAGFFAHYSSLLQLSQGSGWFSSATTNLSLLAWNPLLDVDLTVNTDCEDLLVFMCDIVEFVEQDKAFLLDALFDSWFTLSWTSAATVVTSLEILVILKLQQKTHAGMLTRWFNI